MDIKILSRRQLLKVGGVSYIIKQVEQCDLRVNLILWENDFVIAMCTLNLFYIYICLLWINCMVCCGFSLVCCGVLDFWCRFSSFTNCNNKH